MNMKQKIILALAVFLGSMLIFVGLIIVPLLRAIANNSQNLEEQYIKVLKASLAETEAAEFLKVQGSRQQDFDKVDNLFVNAKTPVDFIRFVEQSARDTNLEVKITPEPREKEKGELWSANDFVLGSSGSYPQFLRFLEKLENGPYLVEARNTSLGKDVGSQNINFTVIIRVFSK